MPQKTFDEAVEDIQRELDVDIDRIDFAIYKAEENKKLNDLDRQILQVGWPHIHGEYGGKWYSNEKEKAMDEYDITDNEIERALKNLASNDPMTKDNIWVLQAVYPSGFGSHGDEFKDPNETRGIIVGKNKDASEIGEVVIKKKKNVSEGLRYPTGKYKNGSYLIHKYVKDEKGKDFLDYVRQATRETGCTSAEAEKAVDRIHRGLSLSPKQKKILQAGWPHLYGNIGEEFQSASKYFSERLVFEIYEELPKRDKEKFQRLANEYSSLRKEIDRYKRPAKTKSSLEKKIAAVQDILINLMRKNGISRHEHKRQRWSIRKVPTYFIAVDSEKAIASIKRKRMSGLLKKLEIIDLSKVKEYIRKHPKKTIPGLKKIDDDYSLYVFDLKSEENNKVEFFFETPYNPSKANNNQLADDVRIIYAHYATWKRTDGKGIKFSLDDLKKFMTKAIVEIKKRIVAGEMNYTFNPEKMKKTSEEFYYMVRETLSDKMKTIGEVDENSEDFKKITVECRDDDNSLELLLNEIKSRGNVGHSFTIILDPGSDDQKQIFWDGDGSDYIKNISKIDDTKEKTAS